MENFRQSSKVVSTCYHCGDTIRGERVEYDEKLFCCSGCKVVYEILQQNDLCRYYSLEQTPGVQPASIESARYDYLADESVQKQLLNFSDGTHASVTLSLPSIHCSSCIWLLEHLYRLDAGVASSQVDFLKKQVTVSFDPTKTSLKNIVVLLASIGYEPELRHDAVEKRVESTATRSLYYKIGIAGFCFGNSMLFSFPEYLGVDVSETALKELFSYLNLILGIPIFFYCSADYFKSSWQGLKRRFITIDLPIAIGIVVLFTRSAYEILTQTGPGFIDSLCGLLFFLLLGRVFQSKTYDRMNFERNYKSYFPISVTTKKNGIETTIPISSLEKGQRIVIRNNEIIPADAMLLRGDAAIDYSFVTGESKPVEKVLGEMIYAGGRQIGGIIELEVMKEVSQSYLTQMWNQCSAAQKEAGQLSELSNAVGKYFTYAVLFVSTAVGLYWLQYDVTTAINAFTGILIVACPCALAISIPFTLGTALRIFGRNNFYLKNTSVIETLSKIDTIIFDKTGTITHPQHSSVEFTPRSRDLYGRGGADDLPGRGTQLTEYDMQMVSSVAKSSVHPLSKVIFDYLGGEITKHQSSNVIPSSDLPASGLAGDVRNLSDEGSQIPRSSLRDIARNDNVERVIEVQALVVEHFTETMGKGISGSVKGHRIKMGSREFAGHSYPHQRNVNESRVYLTIDEKERGYFSIRNIYRDELETTVNELKKKYSLFILSGDNESERARLQAIFPKNTTMLFNQMPTDKMDAVNHLREKNKRVLMMGDGLNDAGALLQSNVGIAVTEDIALFTPSSDAILAGSSFDLLPTILKFSKTSIKIVTASFGFAFMYNLFALFFAVQGELSPIIAAILMPASSITIVVLTTGLTQLLAKRRGLL
ncbi:MAG: heavy metal translocating P-type ATPase metal-binding domain-containing protein [Ignavibacteriales bacterium]|nr:heavy metal translocating P-type ATPase metal-binding domain-containing protein [Ignavibacteriales bacterium]